MKLRFSHLINNESVFKEKFSLQEEKTDKSRSITINEAVIEAVTLYLENTPNIKLDDYLFKSQSNRGKNSNIPLHPNSVDRILKKLAENLGLENKMSTHSMRKTFAYHQMVMSGNDPRKLLLLQKMFGHSTAAYTLQYIGITGEEIDEAYRNLNLGSEARNYLVDGELTEGDSLMA
jgi:site-specific recombinase XerD